MKVDGPTIRGWVALGLALIAGVFVPALLPAKSGHTGAFRPLSVGEWILATSLLIAPLVACALAWHRRPLPDRFSALVALIFTLWMIYAFVDFFV
jgi:hypothetical protein